MQQFLQIKAEGLELEESAEKLWSRHENAESAAWVTQQSAAVRQRQAGSGMTPRACTSTTDSSHVASQAWWQSNVTESTSGNDPLVSATSLYYSLPGWLLVLLNITQQHPPSSRSWGPRATCVTPFLMIKGSMWGINTVNFLHQQPPMMKTFWNSIIIREKISLR